SPTAPAVDGAVGMGTQIPTNLLIGAALHELTHAMGREPGVGPFDLFRYTSPGNHLFSSGSTAVPAYFSIDGGNTKLADFGQTSDASDFLTTGVQGSNDPLDEFYNGHTIQNLTNVDKELLDVMGFDTTALVEVTIEANGVTSLTEIANHFYLYDSTGSGPSLKFSGADFVAGQAGAWAPIGAEKTASGYEVAWKVAGADQYTVWTTDTNGNYISNIGPVSGSSTALQSLEPSFNQDLNGDGHIGPAATVQSGGFGSNQTVAANGLTTLIGGPNNTLDGTVGPDVFVFPSNFGPNVVHNFTPGMDMLQFSQSMFANADDVLSDAHKVGSDVLIIHDPHNVVTLQNTQLANLHAADIHIV